MYKFRHNELRKQCCDFLMGQEEKANFESSPVTGHLKDKLSISLQRQKYQGRTLHFIYLIRGLLHRN